MTKTDVVKALYQTRKEIESVKASFVKVKALKVVKKLIYLISNLKEDNNLIESIATELFRTIENVKRYEMSRRDPRPDEEERGQGSLPGM